MADYIEDIVQNIITRCDLTDFQALAAATDDLAKKASKLGRAFGRTLTGEQKVKIEELRLAQLKAKDTTALSRIETEKARQQTILTNIELEKQRNNVSANRLELQRLVNAKQNDNNVTRLLYSSTAKNLAQKRMETQFSRERTAQIKRETTALRLQNAELHRQTLWGRMGRRIGVYLGAYFGIHTVKNLIDTGSRIQLVQKSIEGLTKSTQDWQFIQQEAFRTGTDIEVAAKGYRNFFSSAKMAGFEKGSIQSMYADVLLSTRAIGASTQQTESALLALEQMLSKGRVSMEELRKQLGNAIPGAFEIGAAAMNMTTAEFNKFVQKVGVASSEFVPKFIAQLKKTYADGFKDIEQTVSVAQIRLSNSFKLLSAEIMSGETGKAFAEGLNVLRETLESPEFKQFIIYMGQLFTITVKLFNFIIKNLRLMLILLGVRGFYGLLVQNRFMFRLLTMEIGHATRALIMLGKAGKLGFGAMSLAGKAFMATLFRVLAPLLIIEDILFFIGEKFWGWNTKSAIGARIAQNKQRIDKKAWEIYPATKGLPDDILKDPRFMKDMEKAAKTHDYSKIDRWISASYAQPDTYKSFGQGGNFTKDETHEVNVRIENINIGNTDNMQMGEVANLFGNTLANTLVEVGVSNGATHKMIGNNISFPQKENGLIKNISINK